MRVQGLLFAAALGLVTSPGRAPAGDAEADALSRAAILSFQKNVDSFTSYTCKYRYFKATAKSLDAALAGNLQNTTASAALLVVDRAAGRERFEILAEMPRAEKGGQKPDKQPGKAAPRDLPYVASALTSLNGKALFYSPLLRVADIREGWDEGFPQPLSLIFLGNLGHFSPYKLHKQCDRGVTKLTSKGSLTDQGRLVIGLTLYQAPPCTVDNDYFFDPQRGYLPVRCLHRRRPPAGTRTADWHNYVVEAKEFPGSRWFPTKVLNVDVEPGKSVVDVRGFEVQELTVDEPLAKDAFAIKIPAGTTIRSPIGEPNQSAFRLRQDESIGPDDIPRIEKMLARSATEPLMDTAIHPPTPFYKRWWFLTGVVVAVLVVAVAVFRHRARVGQPSPQTAPEAA